MVMDAGQSVKNALVSGGINEAWSESVLLWNTVLITILRL
jgi:hypothetical protein